MSVDYEKTVVADSYGSSTRNVSLCLENKYKQAWVIRDLLPN